MSERFDLIIVGTGSAGLSTALAAKGLRVAVLCKGVFGLDGSSCWAQSGVSAALSNADSTIQHAAETLAAGSKAGNKMAVRWMVEDAQDVVRWLGNYGVQWDRNAQGALLSRAAAHGVARVLHAGGDATGAEIMRALRDAVSNARSIEVFEFTEVERLIKMDGKVVGVHARTKRGESVELFGASVVLATGGIGQIYRHTTNPIEATGAGLALAHVAGAAMADLEFVQFHPTALANRNSGDVDQLPLISEALRGAGARIVNSAGVRFLAAVHEQAELAPNDVAARAIFAQMEHGQEVFLDARQLGDAIRVRFPNAFAACKTRGIDPRLDLVPIMPAAHFHMGGIKVDMHSCTSLSGLFAVGEVACTGVHGANRIGGNALLEAISFGRTLGERLARQGSNQSKLIDDGSIPARRISTAPVSESLVYNRLRTLMWGFVGIQRSVEGLQNALDQLQLLEKRCLSGSKVLDQLLVARLITEAAISRSQSLGSHILVQGSAIAGRYGSAAVA
jgi:L-aspartate oxidase